MRGIRIGKLLLRAMALTALVSFADAEDNLQAGDISQPVIVCMDGAPGPLPAQARMIASGMFARIGVSIDWRTSEQDCPGGSIHIRLSSVTPSSLRPGALAYAYPYENTQIVVFYDRITGLTGSRDTPRLLAHVLAHEIAHVLQQISRHSQTGVMKARWSENEIRSMSRKPLPFAAEDVELIRTGRLRKSAG